MAKVLLKKEGEEDTEFRVAEAGEASSLEKTGFSRVGEVDDSVPTGKASDQFAAQFSGENDSTLANTLSGTSSQAEGGEGAPGSISTFEGALRSIRDQAANQGPGVKDILNEFKSGGLELTAPSAAAEGIESRGLSRASQLQSQFKNALSTVEKMQNQKDKALERLKFAGKAGVGVSDISGSDKELIDGMFGKGFTEKYLDTQIKAAKAQSAEDRREAAKDILTIMNRIPCGQTQTFGDKTYKGFCESSGGGGGGAETQVVQETDPITGNTTFTTIREKPDGVEIVDVTTNESPSTKQARQQRQQEERRSIPKDTFAQDFRSEFQTTRARGFNTQQTNFLRRQGLLDAPAEEQNQALEENGLRDLGSDDGDGESAAVQ